jgi:hypothetical protein
LENRIYRNDSIKFKRRNKEPVNKIRIRKETFTFIKYIIKNKYIYDEIANITYQNINTKCRQMPLLSDLIQKYDIFSLISPCKKQGKSESVEKYKHGLTKCHIIVRHLVAEYATCPISPGQRKDD